jgi:hypothetical protein
MELFFVLPMAAQTGIIFNRLTTNLTSVNFADANSFGKTYAQQTAESTVKFQAMPPPKRR